MRNALSANAALWALQAFLALFFVLGSGLPKLVLPVDMLPLPLPLPEVFVRFIGVAEVLGGLGLILPGLTRRHTGLTSLAATCLVVLTICACVYQVLAGQPESAIFALGIGALCAVVAVGRWRVAPDRNRDLAPRAA